VPHILFVADKNCIKGYRMERRSDEDKLFFDALALKFDFKKFERWLNDRRKWPLWPVVFRNLGKLYNKKILDLGCGLGFDSFIFASRGAYVTGIDISPKSIRKARLFMKNFDFKKRCVFYKMNVSSLSFPDESFDAAFGRAILHHVDAEKCLKETYRVVRSKCIFVEPLANNPFVNLNRKFLDKYDRTPSEKPFVLKDLLRTSRRVFPKVDHEEHYLLSPSAYFYRKIIKSDMMFNGAFKMLTKIDSILCQSLPFLRDYCWISIVIAQK